MMQTLQAIEISSGNDIDASVIWLHGLGADGSDFAPVVQMLKLDNVGFILPHAPQRPVSLNGGYVMPAWYDIYGLELGSRQDEAGIRQSQLQIEALIAREQSRGIAAERIVLAGFSQGGAIALQTALRYPQRLGGVLALSTYVPLKEHLAAEAHAANRHIPVFMAHGRYDEVITLATCEVSLKLLQAQGYEVDWHEYEMAHSVCEEEIADIRRFLVRILALQ